MYFMVIYTFLSCFVIVNQFFTYIIALLWYYEMA